MSTILHSYLCQNPMGRYTGMQEEGGCCASKNTLCTLRILHEKNEEYNGGALVREKDPLDVDDETKTRLTSTVYTTSAQTANTTNYYRERPRAMQVLSAAEEESDGEEEEMGATGAGLHRLRKAGLHRLRRQKDLPTEDEAKAIKRASKECSAKAPLPQVDCMTKACGKVGWDNEPLCLLYMKDVEYADRCEGVVKMPSNVEEWLGIKR